jgi:hypothetical protein
MPKAAREESVAGQCAQGSVVAGERCTERSARRRADAKCSRADATPRVKSEGTACGVDVVDAQRGGTDFDVTLDRQRRGRRGAQARQQRPCGLEPRRGLAGSVDARRARRACAAARAARRQHADDVRSRRRGELDDECRRHGVADGSGEHRPAGRRAAAGPAVGAAHAGGLQRHRRAAVDPGARSEITRRDVDPNHALAERERRRVGARQAIGADPGRVVDA